jgi:glucose-1-phosphate adenylyltransferase
MREVLTFIMAGGKGERLNPLTRDRAKPAVPFGGTYRIVDFTLSNCINSGLRRIYVLIQYKSFSLQKHLMEGWRNVVSNQLGEFIDVIPAQQRISSDWYRGTADAIYQNIYAIQDQNPELILILAGDHVYKMDYKAMIDYHIERNADMTVACVAMPVEMSTNFGVIEVDKNHHVCGFQEKPERPKTIPNDNQRIFASMGIYLFSRQALIEELEIDTKSLLSEHDFGKNVIPQMLKNGRKIFVHDFVDDKGKTKYWRDIGTRDAYYQANMDLVKPQPDFELYDRQWPVRTSHEQYPPIKIISVSDADGNLRTGTIIDSLVGGGCIIKGAKVEGSILSPNVRVEKNVSITASVIMNNVIVGENAKIQNAIIDKDVVIPPNAQIGFDLNSDRKRFDVTSSGIVIVAKRVTIK